MWKTSHLNFFFLDIYIRVKNSIFYSYRVFILNSFEILLYDVEFLPSSYLKIFLKRALYFIYNKTFVL